MKLALFNLNVNLNYSKFALTLEFFCDKRYDGISLKGLQNLDIVIGLPAA